MNSNAVKKRQLELFVKHGITKIKVGKEYICTKSCEELEIGENVLAIDSAGCGLSIVLQVLNDGYKRQVEIPIVIAGVVLQEVPDVIG